MADIAKGRKKVRKVPEGYATWTDNRKAVYRASSYIKRLRLLVRAAVTNLDDAAVILGMGENSVTPDEWRTAQNLRAECRLSMRYMSNAGDLIREMAYGQPLPAPTNGKTDTTA